jgi:hypothetical protein
MKLRPPSQSDSLLLFKLIDGCSIPENGLPNIHDISDKGVVTLTQLDGILLNTKCNIKHLKKYVERDANEIEVIKVSNEYTCMKIQRLFSALPGGNFSIAVELYILIIHRVAILYQLGGYRYIHY